MLENDNRVFYRARASWRVITPDCDIDFQPADGVPPGVPGGIFNNSEIVVWRGRVIKDRWNTYKEAELLAAIPGL